MKTTISISVDIEAILKVKEKGLIPSNICNEALWRAVEDPSLINEREQQLIKELDELTRTKAEIEKSKKKEADKKLNEFLSLPKKILDNEMALEYWSKTLGCSVEELVRLHTQNICKTQN